MSESGEILRLRDRVHSLTQTVGILRAEVTVNTKRIERLETQVSEMSRADDIAAAVADALHRRNAYYLLTVPQRIGATIVIAAALGTFILALLGHHL